MARTTWKDTAGSVRHILEEQLFSYLGLHRSWMIWNQIDPHKCIQRLHAEGTDESFGLQDTDCELHALRADAVPSKKG